MVLHKNVSDRSCQIWELSLGCGHSQVSTILQKSIFHLYFRWQISIMACITVWKKQNLHTTIRPGLHTLNSSTVWLNCLQGVRLWTDLSNSRFGRIPEYQGKPNNLSHPCSKQPVRVCVRIGGCMSSKYYIGFANEKVFSSTLNLTSYLGTPTFPRMRAMH